LESDFATALKWHKKLFALSRGMLSLASNPIPVKAAMAMLNLSDEEMRLPLVPMEESKKALLRKTLQEYGLLK
jgi:4-hydroxy-tetrahydrodipicolinate synthase